MEGEVMKSQNSSHEILIVSLLSLVFIFTSPVYAQMQQEPLRPNVPIRKGAYKSWSLFLISNQTWLEPESHEKLKDLYYKFRKFGDAIGPEHLAVWFWKDDPDDDFYNAVDVPRSSAFCSLLKIPPSESPCVVITTDYPGKAQLDSFPRTFIQPENYQVVQLSEMTSSEITDLLNAWADKLILNTPEALTPGSEHFFDKLYRSLRESILDIHRSLKVTVDAKIIKVEYEPD